MDKRLLEFALALPPEQKMRDGQRKWLLRRSVADLLPEAVTARSSLLDRNVSPVFWKRLIASEQPFLRAFLAAPGPVERYVDRHALSVIFSDYERSGFEDSRIISLVEVAVLAAWIKQQGVAV